MKCYTIKALCLTILDSIHMKDEILENCLLASTLFEQHFNKLTPEEQSMGISIYDIELSTRTDNIKETNSYVTYFHKTLFPRVLFAIDMREKLLAQTKEDYDFNQTLPHFENYLFIQMLHLFSNHVTVEQTSLLYKLAKENYFSTIANETASYSHKINSEIIFLIACTLTSRLEEKEAMKKILSIVNNIPLHYKNKTDNFWKDVSDSFETILIILNTFLKQDSTNPSFRNLLTIVFHWMSFVDWQNGRGSTSPNQRWARSRYLSLVVVHKVLHYST